MKWFDAAEADVSKIERTVHGWGPVLGRQGEPHAESPRLQVLYTVDLLPHKIQGYVTKFDPKVDWTRQLDF